MVDIKGGGPKSNKKPDHIDNGATRNDKLSEGLRPLEQARLATDRSRGQLSRKQVGTPSVKVRQGDSPWTQGPKLDEGIPKKSGLPLAELALIVPNLEESTNGNNPGINPIKYGAGGTGISVAKVIDLKSGKATNVPLANAA